MKVNPTTEGVPAHVVHHPSMMTVAEKCALYNLTVEHFSGAGFILDAGLFFGASTIAFTHAIRADEHTLQRVRGRKPVQSYDLAIWTEAFERTLSNPDVREALKDTGTPVTGSSYDHILRRLIATESELVELRIGDICETLELPDHPLEIAFYDCLKQKALDDHVFHKVGPRYEPGTLVVQQDYFYDRDIDLKIRQEALADYFEFCGYVETLAVFRCHTRLPDRFFVNDPVSALSLDDKLALIRQAAARPTDVATQGRTLLALARYQRINGKPAMAIETVQQVRDLVGSQMDGRLDAMCTHIIATSEKKLKPARR